MDPRLLTDVKKRQREWVEAFEKKYSQYYLVRQKRAAADEPPSTEAKPEPASSTKMCWLVPAVATVNMPLSVTLYVRGNTTWLTTLQLPEGLSLVDKETADKVAWQCDQNSYCQVGWKVKASAPREYKLTIRAPWGETATETVFVVEKMN